MRYLRAMKSENIGCFISIVGIVFLLILFLSLFTLSIFGSILLLIKIIFIICIVFLVLYSLFLIIDVYEKFVFLFIKTRKANELDSIYLTELKNILLNQMSLFSTYFNTNIIRALSSLMTPDLIRVLSEVISERKDPKLNSIILKKLSGITKQVYIDEICKVWMNTRHQDLANLLVKKGFTASVPVDVKVYALPISTESLAKTSNVASRVLGEISQCNRGQLKNSSMLHYQTKD